MMKQKSNNAAPNTEYDWTKAGAIRTVLRRLCPHPSWYAKRLMNHKICQGSSQHYYKGIGIKYDIYGRPEYRINRKGDWVKIPSVAEQRRKDLQRKIHPSWEAKIKLRQKAKEQKRAEKGGPVPASVTPAGPPPVGGFAAMWNK